MMTATAGRPGDTTGTGAGPETQPVAPATPRGPAKVVTDRLTAKVGNTLAFTGTGFTPGEQVLGVLDNGLAAIGPMVAGPSGEIAGILPLPGDIEPGTHELRLSGAASSRQATERFAVAAGETDDAAAPVAADRDEDGLAASRIFLLVAAGLFLIALMGVLLLRLARRRRPGSPAAGVA